eukprot:TRINITY_DN6059_c0_g1_i1.p1 TRINITY_DN6059_c0_g1~~TRINITY_DN6059_c0_g1_i1.p1  ORF type:complete len:1090 (+),score=414.82 TRINITY_DN6059_c0_g1_i1:320-3271(+)
MDSNADEEAVDEHADLTTTTPADEIEQEGASPTTEDSDHDSNHDAADGAIRSASGAAVDDESDKASDKLAAAERVEVSGETEGDKMETDEDSAETKEALPETKEESTEPNPVLTTRDAVDATSDNDKDDSTDNGSTNEADAPIWSEHKSDEGVLYYYNRVTEESSWEAPDEPFVPCEDDDEEGNEADSEDDNDVAQAEQAAQDDHRKDQNDDREAQADADKSQNTPMEGQAEDTPSAADDDNNDKADKLDAAETPKTGKRSRKAAEPDDKEDKSDNADSDGDKKPKKAKRSRSRLTEAEKEARRIERELARAKAKAEREAEREAERLKKKAAAEARKAELAAKREAEKEAKRQAKENERKAREAIRKFNQAQKEAQKEALRKQKEEERKQKEAEKEAKRKAKEEEKLRKEAERKAKREAELKAKEEEKKKKEKPKLMMQNFMAKFVKKGAAPVKKPIVSKSRFGRRFEKQQDMEVFTFEPVLSEEELASMDQMLTQCLAAAAEPAQSVTELRNALLTRCRTMPRKHSMLKKPKAGADVEEVPARKLRTDDGRVLNLKYMRFDEDVRPPYFGTFSKTSAAVTAVKPFGQDEQIDYDYDSEAEWEPEPEDGDECLSMDEDEEEAEKDEVDEDDWIVPHGYLSEDEGGDGDLGANDKDDNDDKPADIKRPFTEGCLFGAAAASHPLLRTFKARAMSPLPCDVLEKPPVIAKPEPEKVSKKSTVDDNVLPHLIKLLHGKSMGMDRVCEELTKQLPEGTVVKAAIKRHLKDKSFIVKESLPTARRMVWVVQPEHLTKFDMADLPLPDPSELKPVKPVADKADKCDKADKSDKLDTSGAQAPGTSPASASLTTCKKKAQSSKSAKSKKAAGKTKADKTKAFSAKETAGSSAVTGRSGKRTAASDQSTGQSPAKSAKMDIAQAFAQAQDKQEADAAIRTAKMAQGADPTPVGTDCPWVRYLDEERSLYYFYNRDTQKSSWEAPASFVIEE